MRSSISIQGDGFTTWNNNKSGFIMGMNNETCLDNDVSDFTLPLASCSHVCITNSPRWFLMCLLCCLCCWLISLLHVLIKGSKCTTFQNTCKRKSTVGYLQCSCAVISWREGVASLFSPSQAPWHYS